MKRYLLIAALFVSLLQAQSALLVKKGWQLIGSASDITDMSIFNSKNVEQIWRYDADLQKWRGFSPDSEIEKKIKEKGYQNISSLKSWHGFWIKSKKEWVLTLPQTSSSDENISLKKGWNLISIPVDTVVSPQIFDKMTLWKYANDKWEFFDQNDEENFPKISHITNSDGIWVKTDKDQTIPIVTKSAKLHNFKNIDSLKKYIKDMILSYKRPYYGYFDLAVIGVSKEVTADTATGGSDIQYDTPQNADNSSQTNLQEIGVDEADIIKHNDKYIFYLAADPKNYPSMHINVTTFENIANDKLSPITSFETGGYTKDMYLKGDYLIVLSIAGYENYKPLKPAVDSENSSNFLIDTPSMIVEIFDISTITDIKRVDKFTFDSEISSSRVVDDNLYLITTFNPYIKYDYPKIYVNAPECKDYFYPIDYPQDQTHEGGSGGGGGGTTSLPKKTKEPLKEEKRVSMTTPTPKTDMDYNKYAKCYDLYMDKNGEYYRLDYDNPNIVYEKLLPSYQKNSDPKKALINPQTFYASDKKDQESVITTISKINISEGKLKQSVSILGYSDTIYASPTALYIVSTKYPIYFDFNRYKERSAIYKFDLKDDLSYNAFGFVNGRILNQFSLSEYNDFLRIATTSGNGWQENSENTLYTLKSVEDSLLIQGVLSGLGKKGETIRSVRFMGDKGYIVTFKQTDPFYTIDLSDPQKPKKIGELKIDGFSSYLHPIDSTHILGFGRDATSEGRALGLKIELFNVEDFANPKSVDSYSIPASYARSEIEYNHKALAFRKSDELLAFPYQTYDHIRNSYLGVFQIEGDKIRIFDPIKSSSTLTSEPYQPFQRGIIFDFDSKTFVAYFYGDSINYELLENLKEK